MLIILMILMITIFGSTNGQLCKDIVPDAITQLQNGTIAVFQKTDVWLFTSFNKELVGPCPINKVFEGMEGPIDAAVTFLQHTSITEFVGASLFFTKSGDFFTFRNLRPYQVEWGGLVYLPVKGQQSKMGSGSLANKFMSTEMTAAFFQLNGDKSEFVFPKGETLGYSFELGAEYDIPDHTNLTEVLKTYKVTEYLEGELTAALTLKSSKRIVFFMGSKYCSIYYDQTLIKDSQKCTTHTNDKFFDCKNINHRKNDCGPPKAIGIEESESVQITNAITNAKGTDPKNTQSPPKSRYEEQNPMTKPEEKVIAKSFSRSLFVRQSVFKLLIILFIHCIRSL